MERWTTGENPVSYSKTKAFVAAAKVLTDGIDHDEPGSSKKPKTQEPYDEQDAYPRSKTFCSEIVSAAIFHSQDLDEGSSAATHLKLRHALALKSDCGVAALANRPGYWRRPAPCTLI
jgi:hypothetical protein